MSFTPIGAAGIFSSVLDFNVTSTAVFNTTGSTQEIKVPSRFENALSTRAKARLKTASDGDGKAYTVSGGAPLANGEFEDAGPYAVFLMSGDLTLASVFELTGNYRMVIANGYFEVGFGATLSLDPLGGAEASGMLNISSAGVYGAVQLGGSFKLAGLEFFGAMQLEMNTTNDPVTIDRVQYDFDNRRISDTTIPVMLPANTQRIFNTGSMAIPGFELEGTFELINGPDAIAVTFDATFRAFDALFLHTAGDVNIVKGSNPGIVIDLNATVSSGFFGVDSVFEMESTFRLKVNTRSGGSADQYDEGIARGMVRIDINGNMVLLSTLKLQMGGYIESYAGVFRVEATGSMELLGQYVNGSAFFSSDGEFRVAFRGGIQIGAAGCGVSGSTEFEISRLDSDGTGANGDGNYALNIYGLVQGSVTLFGFSLASASITFGLDGGTGRVYITPRISINFGLFSITVSTTFTLFYVKILRRYSWPGTKMMEQAQHSITESCISIQGTAHTCGMKPKKK
jgi:hypothetical protein